MSVNPNIAGKQYPQTEAYLVGREKVREFARAVFSEDPLNFDVAAAQEAGFSDVVAPPTFGVVIQEKTLAQLLADSEANVDFSRVVHGEQSFEFERPIVAGDELIAQLTITSVKQIGGHSMVTAESKISDQSGALVVTAVSNLVVRGDD